MLLKKLFALGFLALVVGCSGSDVMFGDGTSKAPDQNRNAPETTYAAAMTEEGASGSYTPASYGAASVTFVSQKISTLKNELNQLQSSVKNRSAELRTIKDKMAEDSKKYYEIYATISSRLQMGTTQGNPILNAKWRDATMQLDTINQDVTALNNLAAQITADSGMTTYILDSVRASYNISGAVDEDHNQLKILEDETIQVAVQIERLLTDLNADIARQQQYIVSEKKNLANLAVAIREGQLYSGSNGFPPTPYTSKYRTAGSQSPAMEAAATEAAPAINDARKALVEVRFTKANIAYEQPLYLAMQKAIEHKQDAGFDVVGVAANAADAKKFTDNIVRSMVNMGIPVSRIRTSTSTNSKVKAPEVKVFVR